MGLPERASEEREAPPQQVVINTAPAATPNADLERFAIYVKNGPEFNLITAHQAFLKRAEAHKNFARHAPLEDPASDEELGEPAMEELGDRPPLTQMTLAELRAAAEADEEAHKCQ